MVLRLLYAGDSGIDDVAGGVDFTYLEPRENFDPQLPFVHSAANACSEAKRQLTKPHPIMLDEMIVVW